MRRVRQALGLVLGDGEEVRELGHGQSALVQRDCAHDGSIRAAHRSPGAADLADGRKRRWADVAAQNVCQDVWVAERFICDSDTPFVAGNVRFGAV